MKKIPLLLAMVCAGCASTSSEKTQSPVAIIQNGFRQELGYGIDSQKEIRLKKSPLIIETSEIPNEYAIQVCVTEDTQAVEKITTTKSEFAGHCFSAGTGMAVQDVKNPEEGYVLYVTKDMGHNYYPKDRRVSKSGITRVYINEIKYDDGAVKKSPTVIVYIASNKNHLIEDRELWSGKITWE